MYSNTSFPRRMYDTKNTSIGNTKNMYTICHTKISNKDGQFQDIFSRIPLWVYREVQKIMRKDVPLWTQFIKKRFL